LGSSGAASSRGGGRPTGDTPTGDGPGIVGDPVLQSEFRTSYVKDEVETRELIILPTGDTVDRNMYRDEWAHAVKSFVDEKNGTITAALDDPDKIEAVIEELNATLLNRPRFYFNEDNLQLSHRIVAGVRDFHHDELVAYAGRWPGDSGWPDGADKYMLPPKFQKKTF
jgi:hypothetical protein